MDEGVCMSRAGTFAVCVLLVLLAGGAPRGRAQEDSAGVEISLYAAASLREALQDLTPGCEKKTGARLVVNFAASSDLARQIQAAEKADLFFSADEADMDRLAEAGLLEPSSRKTILSNRLVVVGPADSTLTIRSASDLARAAVRRLSLANPEAVPAGKYARAWLVKAGQWDALKDRVVPAVDVRAALAAVESGLLEAGVVYATDAAVSKKVRILYEVPAEEGPSISYPIAMLRGRPHPDQVKKMEACLTGEDAMKAFRARGFIVMAPNP
jgi:molybdate transport system substrate-binding protein